MNSPESPVVSIVMPVYNGEQYLSEALRSIERQTYHAWELIAVDDGSTDSSPKLLSDAAKRDPRVRVVRQANGGSAAALNTGIAVARGRYIARMDCDDISLPDRLAHQVAALDANPSVGLVGTSYDLIDPAGRPIGRFQTLSEHDDILRELYVRNPFGHGTVMMRREAAREGYRPDELLDDYELWTRLASKYKFANLPEALYQWRLAPGSETQARADEFKSRVNDVVDRFWAQSAPSPLHLKDLIRRSTTYREAGAEAQRQLMFDQHALGLALIARGHRGAGIAALLRATLVRPPSARILRTLLIGDQSTRGYHMYASIPSPSRHGRLGTVRLWTQLLATPGRAPRLSSSS